MKIGMLSQWFDPEPGPSSLPGTYGREFIRQGHAVSVLTGFPNYPTGKIFPGYSQKLRKKEMVDGMQVTRVPLYPSHNSSAVPRILNYASFGLSASALAGMPLKDTDFIWIYNSPITTLLPMVVHGIIPKKPMIVHVQDIWPDSVTESGMVSNEFVKKAFEKTISPLVRFMERSATVVAVIAPSVKDLILERNPKLDPGKIVYIPNPTNEELFKPSAPTSQRKAYPWSEGFSILYSGAIGHVQGLDTLVRAVRLLSDIPDLEIVFVGDGIALSDLEELAEEAPAARFHFLGRVPMEEIPSLSASADVQLVSLNSEGFLKHTMPSKIASLLAMGLPILGVIDGDPARVIRQSGAGVTAEPKDEAGVADAIRYMYQLAPRERREMGDKGRAYYLRNLSASAATHRIIDAISPFINS